MPVSVREKEEKEKQVRKNREGKFVTANVQKNEGIKEKRESRLGKNQASHSLSPSFRKELIHTISNGH